MADLLDYLYWRGDLSMQCLPFTAVDALILSWFVSLPHREPVPGTVGEAAEEVCSRLEGESAGFAAALARSTRFRYMPVLRFEQKFSEEEEMQFAAITAKTGDGMAFVAYRGTDATLVGWKEDFNMAFSDEVPAQREALRYLEETAQMLNMPMRVGGHSKGGNLAMYAAARCSSRIQQRIEAVFNFDGPGGSAALMQSPGYRRIESRLETYLPESSVVGILLERAADYRVVRSDNVGPMQHAPSSWRVTPVGFEPGRGLDKESLYAERTIRGWLEKMSLPERRVFIDALYEIATASGAQTVSEIAKTWRNSGAEMLETFAGMDLRTKAVLFRGVGGLIASAVRQLPVQKD